MTQSGSRVPKVGAGDTSGLDWPAVLAEHQRWLRTIVYARLREPAAVDDVLQEVSLAAIRQAAPLVDRGKAAPWLYQLAIRQCLLHRRKQGRQRNTVARFAEKFRPAEHDARTPDPLDWLLADERRHLIRVALARLPRRDGEMLLLKYTENWNYRQIAGHLGTTPSAVEARLHRARARLRGELAALQVVETRS